MVIRTARRLARRGATVAIAPAASAALRPRLALHEHHLEHVTGTVLRPSGGHDAARVRSRRLAALRAIAERCGASAVEQRDCAPTNIARNYYDGGRDFDVCHTLELTFASVDAAARFFAQARPLLAGWLAGRRAHTAELHLDTVEIVLSSQRDLDLAQAQLQRSAVVQSRRARRRAAGA